jgi:hypothetical protein
MKCQKKMIERRPLNLRIPCPICGCRKVAYKVTCMDGLYDYGKPYVAYETCSRCKASWTVESVNYGKEGRR